MNVVLDLKAVPNHYCKYISFLTDDVKDRCTYFCEMKPIQ